MCVERCAPCDLTTCEKGEKHRDFEFSLSSEEAGGEKDLLLDFSLPTHRWPGGHRRD